MQSIVFSVQCTCSDAVFGMRMANFIFSWYSVWETQQKEFSVSHVPVLLHGIDQFEWVLNHWIELEEEVQEHDPICIQIICWDQNCLENSRIWSRKFLCCSLRAERLCGNYFSLNLATWMICMSSNTHLFSSKSEHKIKSCWGVINFTNNRAR
jgi:hypothetical protein